jgi:hypothetical protein
VYVAMFAGGAIYEDYDLFYETAYSEGYRAVMAAAGAPEPPVPAASFGAGPQPGPRLARAIADDCRSRGHRDGAEAAMQELRRRARPQPDRANGSGDGPAVAWPQEAAAAASAPPPSGRRACPPPDWASGSGDGPAVARPEEEDPAAAAPPPSWAAVATTPSLLHPWHLQGQSLAWHPTVQQQPARPTDAREEVTEILHEEDRRRDGRTDRGLPRHGDALRGLPRHGDALREVSADRGRPSGGQGPLGPLLLTATRIAGRSEPETPIED